jgi:hypothetical protein
MEIFKSFLIIALQAFITFFALTILDIPVLWLAEIETWAQKTTNDWNLNTTVVITTIICNTVVLIVDKIMKAKPVKDSILYHVQRPFKSRTNKKN